MAEKLTIKNRRGQKIVVLVEKSQPQIGLAFVMHGLGGYKEAPHLEILAQSFLTRGYTVVRFDTTNTYGESEGDYADATVTNYYQDLEDVIEWVRTRSWYKEPFILSGHSLGGMCSALYAEKYPERIKALAPISTVVSGRLSVEAHQQYEPQDFKKWEQTGWREKESGSKPGLIKRLKWSHIADRLKYDLLPGVSKLTMPVLLIVGENDESTPSAHQKIFLNVLPGEKELHIIKNAPHTFRDKKQLDKITEIFDHWLVSIDHNDKNRTKN